VLTGGSLVSGGEAGIDSLHAEAPHDSQCDGEEGHAMAGDSHSAHLKVKTMTDPSWLLNCPLNGSSAGETP